MNKKFGFGDLVSLICVIIIVGCIGFLVITSIFDFKKSPVNSFWDSSKSDKYNEETLDGFFEYQQDQYDKKLLEDTFDK